MNHIPYVLVIGGANIDFVGLPHQKLIWHDKNPGAITTSLGGVGRNIAENLARLQIPTKLLAVVGDDTYGNHLIEQTATAGVDTSLIHQLSNQRSSVYLSIMDTNDDMALAMSDMAIIEKVTPEFIDRHDDVIRSADIVVLDTNLPTQTLNHLLIHFSEVCFFVDTVSVSKSEKIASLLAHIDTIKPNKMEAEYLSGVAITDTRSAHKACKALLAKGLNNVYLSMGADGLLYANNTSGIIHQLACTTQVINAAGAGDALMAALVYSTIKKMPVAQSLAFICAAASLTLTAESTIHPDMSPKAITEFMNQNTTNH